ncbi:MAG TPA: hypothetical protein VNA87_04215 [Actinomycetota bacterium]|nr:hypothetical protein [Actinomycetota bacterium]
MAFFVAYHPAWEPNEPPELPADSVPHLDLTAMFLLTFSVRDRETVDVSDLEHFVVLNATFNAWPYWRELVQSTTLRMGIPPLIVPVFVFPTALGNRAED